MVTNSKSKLQAATYNHRQSRGQARAIYNEGVTKMSGQYNPEAKAEITIHTSQRPFDMLNLTSLNRTQFLQEQFDLIEDLLKKQLCTESFEEFMSPAQSCQRVCGRVINISTEDTKIKEGSIGLFNANYDQ